MHQRLNSQSQRFLNNGLNILSFGEDIRILIPCFCTLFVCLIDWLIDRSLTVIYWSDDLVIRRGKSFKRYSSRKHLPIKEQVFQIQLSKEEKQELWMYFGSWSLAHYLAKMAEQCQKYSSFILWFKPWKISILFILFHPLICYHVVLVPHWFICYL